jgi:hypothetical protein
MRWVGDWAGGWQLGAGAARWARPHLPPLGLLWRWATRYMGGLCSVTGSHPTRPVGNSGWQPSGWQPVNPLFSPTFSPYHPFRRYITVSEVSDRQLWYLVADREQDDDPYHDLGAASTTAAGSTGVASEADSGSSSGAGGGGGAGRRPEPGDDEAPVILWLTGGPGCSSLDAFIYEHGPFKFSYGAAEAEGAEEGAEAEAGAQGRERRLQQRQRQVLLDPNPYSWTKVATVIYVDSPAGSGMSYSGRPDVDYHTNDEYTIADLVLFLEVTRRGAREGREGAARAALSGPPPLRHHHRARGLDPI